MQYAHDGTDSARETPKELNYIPACHYCELTCDEAVLKWHGANYWICRECESHCP